MSMQECIDLCMLEGYPFALCYIHCLEHLQYVGF